jgi:hypothetical protein
MTLGMMGERMSPAEGQVAPSCGERRDVYCAKRAPIAFRQALVAAMGEEDGAREGCRPERSAGTRFRSPLVLLRLYERLCLEIGGFPIFYRATDSEERKEALEVFARWKQGWQTTRAGADARGRACGVLAWRT